ncbi:homoserine kinase [Helicobacter anatolicus]|uniref:homoserine kinase n=1 Tax=Helicobacter anatolicus TaxID=2905874 RepID=UPI001E41C825|nr:homoserine kinase [Helicobacter anatolicus]MCE3038577.1 homoserine kinase [Helicobacter anatolicus]
MIISVPATSANLGPGFDSLGLSLDFRNFFHVEKAKYQSIKIVGEGEGYLKIKVDNVFVKIFMQNLEKTNIAKDKYSFFFNNKIPISRGLGSSSAVISGAIGMAQLMQNGSIDKQKILDTALVYENHPDNITPAIFGGFNVAVVEKNRVYHLRENIPDDIRAVVVIPNRATSTKHSRQTLPKYYSSVDTTYNLSHASLMTMAFAQKKWDLLRIASKDRMHQYRRMKQYPVLFSVQKIALDKGALMSTLSGSGSSFLNICFKDDAPRIAKALQDKFTNFRVLDLAFDNEGLRIEKE